MDCYHPLWYLLPDARLCNFGGNGGRKWISYSYTPIFFSR